MSRRRRKKKDATPDDSGVSKFDWLEGGALLAETGGVGVAIALVGGAIAVVAGVFKFMSRRS